MKMFAKAILTLTTTILFSSFVSAQSMSDQNAGGAFKDTKNMKDHGELYRLYTPTDPASPGGIRGKIVSPDMPIKAVIAVPPADPEKAYMGTIGTDGREFSFDNLPMGRYDLLVIYQNSFYEGVQLHRDENTLTPQDIKKIEYIVNKSEKFWKTKRIHRVEGTTGRGNTCRAMVSMCKTTREGEAWFDVEKMKKITGRGDEINQLARLTYKIFSLKDVGVGWQVTHARDLFPGWVDRMYMNPTHHFSEALQRVRVSDYVKDLGEISL